MLRHQVSKPALFMTLALHALLLLAVVGLPMAVRAPPPPPAGANDSVVRIRFYSEGQAVHLEHQASSEMSTAVADEPCSGDFYVGIGIVAGSYSGLVILVAPGAPAARAGIRAGEEILNAEVLGANRYAVGTPLDLQVAGTDGSQRRVSLRVEKICNA
jgi:S1-C subfamily serine protease